MKASVLFVLVAALTSTGPAVAKDRLLQKSVAHSCAKAVEDNGVTRIVYGYKTVYKSLIGIHESSCDFLDHY